MQLAIKIVIALTVALSFLAACIPSLQALLALSWTGIAHFYVWQLITYLFVAPHPISLGHIVQIGLNMYLLWMFGSSFSRHFFVLYFGSGLFAALATLAPLYFFHTVTAGATPAIYAILIAWSMLNPHSQLLLFFAIPFKAHWLIAGWIGLTFFLDISSHNWSNFVSLLASCAFSYLFTLIVWRQPSPFDFFHSFERKVFRLLERKTKKSGSPTLDDEPFMDAMLEKISRLGEKSLTPQEKKRMQAISEQKK